MKKTYVLILFLICLSMNQLHAQDGKKWVMAWDKISKYEEKGLPQSALKLVDSVFNEAIEAGADEQVLKATIYRIKLKNYYQENQIVEAIESIRLENDDYSPELKAFSNMLAAKLYRMYYTRNRYNIDRRTSTGNFREDDIETWTKDDFSKAIDKHFNKVLEHKNKLAKISIKKFPEIIKQDDYSFEIQPSLYDFFAHEMVDHYVNQYKNNRHYNNQEKPWLQKPDVFLPALLFVTTDYSMDKGNDAEKAMAVLKGLLKYRLSDDITVARVYTDLRRLRIAKRFFSGQNAEDKHFTALSHLHMQFEDKPVVKDIAIELAKWYKNKADDIQHIPGDTVKAANYKKADSICDIIIEEHSKSAAVKEAMMIKKQLRDRSLDFKSENNVIAEQAFPVYVEYKNIEKLQYSVLKIDPEEFKQLKRKHYGKQRIEALLNAGDIIRERQLEMPGNPDFVKHSTEFVSEPLKSGFYVIFLSLEGPGELEDNYIVCRSMFVSNISWYTSQKSNSEQIRLFVTDSKSGKPVVNAKVKVLKQIYDYKNGKYIYKREARTKTSDEGIAVFNPGDDYSNYAFEIDTGDEILLTGEQYYYNYNRRHGNRSREKVHFFTDRAVYRPGQTIHVKGICLQGKDKQQKLMKNYTTSIRLLDANRQTVSEKTVTTNEFGSFNTEFIIPEGLLNGRLTLKTPHGSTNVMLEAYKRPSFEVKIDDFDGNYMLGEEMTIDGVAESYTGASVSNAAYKYRIYREPVFQNRSMYYYSYLPRQRKMVTHGNGKTDKTGRFNLDFMPKAAPSYPKDQDISFRFVVEIDITDITGETQSDTRSVTIGYRTLKMHTNLPENMDVSDIDSLTIESMNLNNEQVGTEGSLVIYKLEQPGEILVDKAWNVPEFPMLSKEEWKDKLPGHAYADENEIQHYPEEKQLADMAFDTGEKQQYTFPGSGKLKPGAYKIELHAEDVFGVPVVEEEFIRIYDRSARKTKVLTPLSLNANTYVYSVGDVIELEVVSAFSDAMAYVVVEHENENLYDQWINLDKSREILEFEVTEELRGGATINAILIKNGEIYQKTRNITVPYENKQLQVEYLHFRDETMPGQDEE
ncbi:MAG: MG2 domain-containing protein, partial [Bacteroidota bacterium]